MHPDTLYCSLPLLCLLHFQGWGPTCSSCWAADWLAAALHEGWVKGQEGLHDPAQPGNQLFQKLSFWRLQTSLMSETTRRHRVSFLHKSRHTSVKFNTQLKIWRFIHYCLMLLTWSYTLPHIVWTLCTQEICPCILYYLMYSNMYTPPCTVMRGRIMSVPTCCFIILVDYSILLLILFR